MTPWVILEAPIHSPGTGRDDPATTRVLKAPVRSLGTGRDDPATTRVLKAPVRSTIRVPEDGPAHSRCSLRGLRLPSFRSLRSRNTCCAPQSLTPFAPCGAYGVRDGSSGHREAKLPELTAASRRERPLSVHPDGATSLPSRLRCSRRYARCAPRPSHAVSRHGGRDSARPAPFHVAGSACLRLAQAAQPGEGQACCSGGNERGCPLDPSRTMQAPQGAKRLRSAASVPRAQRVFRELSERNVGSRSPRNEQRE